jgi:hypothetical protein
MSVVLGADDGDSDDEEGGEGGSEEDDDEHERFLNGDERDEEGTSGDDESEDMDGDEGDEDGDWNGNGDDEDVEGSTSGEDMGEEDERGPGPGAAKASKGMTLLAKQSAGTVPPAYRYGSALQIAGGLTGCPRQASALDGRTRRDSSMTFGTGRWRFASSCSGCSASPIGCPGGR